MLSVIFLREMLDTVVSRRFLFVSILCCTLIPLGIVVNQRALDQIVAHQQQAKAEFERNMQGFLPSDQVEVKVFRERSHLAGLASGLDQAVPSTITIRQDGMSYGISQLLDNPVAALFGRIDLLFIVKFVLSLIAIIFSYDMICGEKESGTLRLILSGSVPRDSILLGKYLSGLVTLMVPFAAGLLIGLLLLQVQGGRALSTGADWLAVAMVFVVATLYIACFLSLGVFVSTCTTRPLVSITVLLMLWAVGIAIVPQLGAIIAEIAYPVESAESHYFKKSLAADDVERRRTAELHQFFRDPDYDEIRKPVAQRYALELERTYAQMDQEYQNRRRNQFHFATAIASLSPVTPMTFALTSLSGTGVLQADHFQSRLAEYRELVASEIYSQGFRDLKPGVGGAMVISNVQLEDVPRFASTMPPLADVVREIWPKLLLLLGFNLVFFLGAYLRFRRYDVR